jgi:FAD:protein FMN transferase
MKLHSKAEVRRARPLLGTIVDLSGDGPLDAGFAAIEKTQRLMSFFNEASDVSRINRDAFARPVRVHPWTCRVLRAGIEFAERSNGAFDFTIRGKGSWCDVVLEPNDAVRFRRKIIIDLGGIAKGFAVDRAVEALRRAGLTSGVVNAGGDIRAFGPALHEVHLRDPQSPTHSCGLLRLRNRALATSATYFSPGALRHGRTRRSITSNVSVTVAAADCMTADALTKIVMVMREKAAPLLIRYRANALWLERRDKMSIFPSSCDIRVPIR